MAEVGVGEEVVRKLAGSGQLGSDAAGRDAGGQEGQDERPGKRPDGVCDCHGETPKERLPKGRHKGRPGPVSGNAMAQLAVGLVQGAPCEIR